MFGSKKPQNPPDLAFLETSLPPDFRDVHPGRFLLEDIWNFESESNVQTTTLIDLANGSVWHKFEGRLAQTPISF